MALQTRLTNESTFEVSAENVIALPSPCEDSVLVVLQPSERIYFHGKVKISVKKGSVSILGHILRGGYQETSKKRKKPQIQSNIYYSLFSPFTSSALSIEHSNDTTTIQAETPEIEGQTEFETTERQQIIEEVLAAFDFPDEVSVIVLRRFGNNTADSSNNGTQLFVPPSTFVSNYQQRNKTKDASSEYNFGIPDFFPLINNSSSWAGISILPAWKNSFHVVASSNITPVVLVCGTKNAGKSTYCRCLANNLLNHFPSLAWLETDLGQPEFAAPGMVALSTVQVPLFGTPMTHPIVPERAFFVGATSPNDPEFYLKCIQDLYQDFLATNTQADGNSNQTLSTPVIVNTHGWVKGLGKDILLQLIRLIQPTHIMQITSSEEPDKLSLNSVCTDYYRPVIVDVPSIAASNAVVPIGAPEKRLHQLLSYLTKGRIHVNPSASPMESIKLYEVPWFSENGNIRVCTSKHSGIAYSELLVALNGQLVGLASDPSQYKFRNDQEQQYVTQNQLPLLIPYYPSCPCVGLGIVYKIDPDRKIFQILSPVDAEEIQDVNTLLLGQLDAPTALALLTTPHGLIPYLSSHSKEDAAAGSGLIDRKFIKRRFKKQ